MQTQAALEERVFQALAEPRRRAILEALSVGEVPVKSLTARFAISQPAISQHLAVLTEAGLVRGRREGRCVFYSVEPQGLEPLLGWLAHYREFWTGRFERLERLLEKLDR